MYQVMYHSCGPGSCASQRSFIDVLDMKINCNNVAMEAKAPVKYLGVVLDQDMSGKTMGSIVVKKVNSVLKFLYRKKCFLNFKNGKLLCTALIQSRLDYGHNIFLED